MARGARAGATERLTLGATTGGLKGLVPWHARIAAKIVLSRAPLPYGLWRRMRLFRHGAMTDVAYASQVFARHLDALPTDRRAGFTGLELGPGDSLFSVVLARLAGAAKVWCIDAGAFAVRDIGLYREAAERLVEHRPGAGISPAKWQSVDDMLADCGGAYGTRGLESLREVPDGSVDLSWSQAVLEHVRRAEFAETMRELRRVARPGAVSSHQVDLRDHLGGALNNLRFTRETWEGALFSESGFYTNRIRFSEMAACFRAAGFEVLRLEPHRWEALPTPRARLAAEFRHLPEDELRVSDFYALLRA